MKFTHPSYEEYKESSENAESDKALKENITDKFDNTTSIKDVWVLYTIILTFIFLGVERLC